MTAQIRRIIFQGKGWNPGAYLQRLFLERELIDLVRGQHNQEQAIRSFEGRVSIKGEHCMSHLTVSMIDYALKRVKSQSDIEELAEAIMKLTRLAILESDVLDRAERVVLTAMIEETVKKTGRRNLASVLVMLERDLDIFLAHNHRWLEFKAETSERFRDSALARLKMRLAILPVKLTEAA